MKINNAIELIESRIKSTVNGLPEDVFLFVTKITPIVNVDLLIKNKKGHTLLTWRDDGFYSAGWHIPGGIVRYKERIAQRIRAVARNEIGAGVSFSKEPLAIREVIHRSRRVRGHFISLLYECSLKSHPNNNLRYDKGTPKPGEWSWFKRCPRNIITVHRMYRKFI